MSFFNKCGKMSIDELEDLQAHYEEMLETIYYWIEEKTEGEEDER